MKRKRWLVVISFSFIVLFIPTSTLLHTEQGLVWLAQIISLNAPGKLSFDSIKGSVSSEIEITNLDYQNANVTISMAHAKFVWQPWKLFSGLLLVDSIDIDGINIRTLSSTTTNAPLKLPDIVLPFRFSLHDISLNRLHLHINNAEPLKFAHIKLSANSDVGSILVPNFTAETDDFTISLNGKIIPKNNYDVDIISRFQLKDLFSQPFIISADFKGNLKELRTTANVSGFMEGSLKGKLNDVVNNLHWNATANVNKMNLSSFSADLPANNISGKIQSGGSLDNFTLSGNAITQYSQWGEITANYSAAIVDNELVIDNLQLEESNHSALISSQGSINWGGDETIYKLAGRWQKVSWPWIGETKYHSPSGNLNFSGKLSDYNLNVDTEVEGENLPISTLVAEASGNSEKIGIRSLRVDTMDGDITGNGFIDWKKELHWNANLNFNKLNPKAIAPDISGKISANLKVTGSMANSSYIIDVGLNNINGELQSKPLSGSADVRFINDDILVKELSLKLNETALTLRGNLGTRNNLQFNLKSNNLSGILPALQGKLSATGSVLGHRDTPRLILDLSASNLTYKKYSVESMSTVADITIDPQQTLKLDLMAKNLKIDEMKVDDVRLNINGKPFKHRIELKVKKQQDTAELAIVGGITDSVWQGNIIESAIKSKSIGDWQLEKSSHLLMEIGGGYAIELDKICYTQQQTHFCFNAEHKDSGLTAGLEWKHLAVEKFRYWLPPEIKINSLLNGSAKLEFSDKKQLFASINTTNTAGDFSVALDTGNQKINFDPGEISFDWNPLQIKSSIRLPLGDQAKIEADAFIDHSNTLLALEQQPLKGDIILQLPTLIFLGPFIPALKNLGQANAEAKLQLSGSLQQPVFSGNASAGAAQLHVPDLNITLNNTAMNVHFNKKHFVEFTAETTSGKGKIKVDGEARYTKEKTWSGKSTIRGVEFKAIDLPEGTVHVSPELVLRLINNKLQVEGDITMPYARLHPKNMSVGTATETADLVIVGSDQNTAPDRVNWQTESKVRLILGDRVSFDGYGLRSKLTGSLQIIDKPNEVTIGRGEINLVDGFYRSFGQELQISKGRFLFSNTSIDDPSLDIRAHRLVGEIKAGVNVTSTLRKPEVRLFSEPIMSESDILSYLLLGRPVGQINQSEGNQLMTAATAMGLAGGELLARTIGNRLGIEEVLIQTDKDSGSSSLVIGRYLTPKLYIRYFAGIFERSNIVQLRYNASKKVIIQTETGSQMGADVFYTIER